MEALSRSETPPRSRGNGSWASNQLPRPLHPATTLRPPDSWRHLVFSAIPHPPLKPLCLLQTPYVYYFTPRVFAGCLPQARLCAGFTNTPGDKANVRAHTPLETHVNRQLVRRL